MLDLFTILSLNHCVIQNINVDYFAVFREENKEPKAAPPRPPARVQPAVPRVVPRDASQKQAVAGSPNKPVNPTKVRSQK